MQYQKLHPHQILRLADDFVTVYKLNLENPPDINSLVVSEVTGIAAMDVSGNPPLGLNRVGRLWSQPFNPPSRSGIDTSVPGGYTVIEGTGTWSWMDPSYRSACRP